MKVGTPLGEYPFEFRCLERRGGTVAIVGRVAGLESSVVLDADDLRQAAKLLVAPTALAVLLALGSRRCR